MIIEIVAGMLFVMALVGWAKANNHKDEIKKLRHDLDWSRARPAPLKYLKSHFSLLGSETDRPIIIRSFIPDKKTVADKELRAYNTGTVLLAVPGYPDYVFCCEGLFEYGDEIKADSKTLYEIKEHALSKILHLKEVSP